MNGPDTPERAEACVDDVLITEELGRRPSRAPDHAAENRALGALAREMAASPGTVLQKLTDLMVEFGWAQSAGVSILEPHDPSTFRWHAVSGLWAGHVGGTMPVAGSPCGVVVARDSPLLFARPHEHFPAAEVEPLIREILLVPFHAAGRPTGTLWAIAHDDERRFDAEDLRVLTGLARFASAAHQLTGALAEAERGRGELERRVEERTEELVHANDRLRGTEARLAADLAGMRRLHDLHAKLATETDLRAALGDILAVVVEFVGTDRGCVQLVSDDGERLEMFATHGYGAGSGFIGHFMHEGSKPACDVARRQRKRMIIEDVATFPGLTGTRDREVALEEDIRATCCTPMLSRKGETVGVLCAQFRRPHRPADHELRLIDLLGWTAAAFVERHCAEAALRESEARFRALVTATSDVVYRMSPDWAEMRRLHGRGFLADTGHPRRDWLDAYIHPDDQPGVLDAIRRAVRDRAAFALEHRVRRADGTLGWTSSRAVPMLDARGEVLEWFGAAKDVTARREAEAALREGEARQAFLLRLSDALRPLGDASEIQTAASRLLGEHLGADRAFYCEIEGEPRARVAVVRGQYVRRGAPLPGRLDYDSFEQGWASEILPRGEPVVVVDADREPRALEGTKAAWRAVGVGALVVVSLVKGGRESVNFGVFQDEPRRWSPAEVELVRDVAERTWAAAERARAERTLRESEARFRTLAETIEDVFYTTDLDRNALLYLGPAYERVWGRPAAELHADLGAFIGTVHPDDRARFLAGKERQERGEPIATEYRIVRPDGEVRWIFDRSFPIKWGDGDRRAAGVACDVTARKEAEAALRESEERFRQFGEASSDVVWVRDAGTLRWEYLSPAFEAIYGLARDEALAGDTMRNWADLILPEDRERALASIGRVGNGERVTFEYRIRRPADGEVRWLRNTDFPMRDGTGRVVRIGGIGQDVTGLKAAEAALRASEERQRALVEGVPHLVWRSAAGGEWTWAGPQWVAFTGLPAEASLGHGWLEAVHPDDGPAALASWTLAGPEGRFEADYRLLHAASGRYFWFRTRGMPVRGEADGTVEWLGTSTDIDDQVSARELLSRGQEELEARVAARTAELMAAEESLRQSQKMEAVGQLTGGIAHDFNNMLQGVAGGIEMARRRVAEGRAGDAARYLDAARAAAQRAAGLTRRLLAFARRQRLDPKPVDADALVAGMADLIRRAMGPGIGLELRLRDGSWSVLCDPSELENALLNLCINARDAMPDGGRLLIATREARVSAADAAGQEGATAGDHVAISVSDTGTGMTPEVAERVFEPFFTTKPLGQGTGLGLSQIYGFVRQSGGFVRIESAPGQGTTVSLFLPKHARVEAPADERAVAPATPERAGAAGTTVLLVDDEAAARGPAAERLRELGHSVLEAADGPAALRLLGDGARIDLLVTDVGLPNGMNGRQVAEAVRERAPGVPVLFITGYAASTPLPPGTEVIGKPFELDALARRVQALLAAGRTGRRRTARSRPDDPQA